MASFKELLKLSFKSEDTEEWLDVHFTRPIGLAFALFWNRLDVHPNVITIISIFLGVGAGVMFSYTDLMHNIYGVLLLMFANFCDSTDGQMARITGKKTLIGRMLDGFAGDLWFVSIYLGIVYRLWDQPMPFLDTNWGIWGFVLCAVAGFLFHSDQVRYTCSSFWVRMVASSTTTNSSVKPMSLCQRATCWHVPSTSTMPTTARVRRSVPPSSRSSSSVGSRTQARTSVRSSSRAVVH